eukprot:554143-Rhodomonas_salina.1
MVPDLRSCYRAVYNTNPNKHTLFFWQMRREGGGETEEGNVKKDDGQTRERERKRGSGVNQETFFPSSPHPTKT